MGISQKSEVFLKLISKLYLSFSGGERGYKIYPMCHSKTNCYQSDGEHNPPPPLRLYPSTSLLSCHITMSMFSQLSPFVYMSAISLCILWNGMYGCVFGPISIFCHILFLVVSVCVCMCAVCLCLCV